MFLLPQRIYVGEINFTFSVWNQSAHLPCIIIIYDDTYIVFSAFPTLILCDILFRRGEGFQSEFLPQDILRHLFAMSKKKKNLPRWEGERDPPFKSKGFLKVYQIFFLFLFLFPPFSPQIQKFQLNYNEANENIRNVQNKSPSLKSSLNKWEFYFFSFFSFFEKKTFSGGFKTCHA